MFTIYELHTNEGKFLVSEEPTREQMLAYRRKKRQSGMPLSSVIFSWGLRVVHRNAVTAAGAYRFDSPVGKAPVMYADAETGKPIEKDT